MEGPGPDLAIARRRALYRAQHRGTREMDWLLGWYAEAVLPDMDATDLAAFEQLLTVPDPDLHAWITHGTADLPEHQPLIAAIRRHHGLAERQADR